MISDILRECVDCGLTFVVEGLGQDDCDACHDSGIELSKMKQVVIDLAVDTSSGFTDCLELVAQCIEILSKKRLTSGNKEKLREKMEAIRVECSDTNPGPEADGYLNPLHY